MSPNPEPPEGPDPGAYYDKLFRDGMPLKTWHRDVEDLLQHIKSDVTPWTLEDHTRDHYTAIVVSYDTRDPEQSPSTATLLKLWQVASAVGYDLVSFGPGEIWLQDREQTPQEGM